MHRTRGCLYFAAGYLYLGGAGFLVLPSMMLTVLFAEGIYSMVTLRLLGAVMIAMGILLSGVIEQKTEVLYRYAINAMVPLWLALAYLYLESEDRMWAILLVPVFAGWLAAFAAERMERKSQAARVGG
jgi:hypothetical protein